jgi:hypothetical protein
VETSKTLESENEFGVPADKYYILAALDPETGQRVVNIVALQTNPGSPVLYRELDSKTDKPEREERYELLNSGGLKAGATTERWYRKLVRFYDRATGKVVKEEVFRYDEKVPDSHWTKVPG